MTYSNHGRGAQFDYPGSRFLQLLDFLLLSLASETMQQQ
jgi:hypothetical protein